MEYIKHDDAIPDNDVIAVYNDKFDLLIHEFFTRFCSDPEKIDSYITNNAPQNQWNACMKYIYSHLFRNSDYLRDKNSVYVKYDEDKLLSLADIYIYYCDLFDKIPTVYGFSSLSGVSISIIHEWGDEKSSRVSHRLSELINKLRTTKQEALSGKLASNRGNPVGILGILNHDFMWNMPGVTHEKSRRDALPAESLPVLAIDTANESRQNLQALESGESGIQDIVIDK